MLVLGEFGNEACLHYPVFDIVPLFLPCDFVFSSKSEGVVRSLRVDNFKLSWSPDELLRLEVVFHGLVPLGIDLDVRWVKVTKESILFVGKIPVDRLGGRDKLSLIVRSRCALVGFSLTSMLHLKNSYYYFGETTLNSHSKIKESSNWRVRNRVLR